ncbi:helix-turn-helix domain-containing protein [Limosilactobacillus fastidiosus]|uniref:helix-turn-helix domain-containing protein n=1 Tax=Limosilactobacillus fastidiosus TaxID=2759855 RepID=UPI001E62E697|nr:helix-turn-helix domain-containing protein [Limosilactobacillus fastidiosus]MCD7083971.1 helix-turn-helix domain containing protein [Limosilactobacillus fastidiosus]
MSKYSSRFKATIVSEYLAGQSSSELNRHYHVPQRQIQKWVQMFRMNGPQALQRRRRKRSFTLDFKLAVINYYQTHEESLAKVGTKFNLLPSQIDLGIRDFQSDGIEANLIRRVGHRRCIENNIIKNTGVIYLRKMKSIVSKKNSQRKIKNYMRLS